MISNFHVGQYKGLGKLYDIAEAVWVGFSFSFLFFLPIIEAVICPLNWIIGFILSILFILYYLISFNCILHQYTNLKYLNYGKVVMNLSSST